MMVAMLPEPGLMRQEVTWYVLDAVDLP